MAQHPPCFRFFTNLMAMKEPLLTIVTKGSFPGSIITPGFVEFAFLILSGASEKQQFVLDTFIDRSYQHWDLIATTNDVSAILDAALGGFKELGQEHINEIKKMAKSENVDVETRLKLLRDGRTLVKIALRHLHAIKSSLVDVRGLAKKYELDLDSTPGVAKIA